MVNGHVTVFEHGGELNREACEQLRVAKGEEVLTQDARPKGWGPPVPGTGIFVFAYLLLFGQVSPEEVGDVLVAIEKDYREGDHEG